MSRKQAASSRIGLMGRMVTLLTSRPIHFGIAYRMLHLENGYTLYDVRNRLRHATIQTTERVYDHFDRI